MKRKRAIIIVLDGVGIGSSPDAAAYGDEGANTLKHVLAETGVSLPNLRELGLGNLGSFDGLPGVENPHAFYGILLQSSAGKDTVTGHWEMMGLTVGKPFPVFPRGFPAETMKTFELETGYGYLWNRPASGTEIIEKLGKEHIESGKPIVYTSADSVFQVAAHVKVIPELDLYEICRVTREVVNTLRVLRVIARPFDGEPGSFFRTSGRKDFPLEPDGLTAVDVLLREGVEVISVGKVGEMFSGRGFTRILKTEDNADTLETLMECMGGVVSGLIFSNLNDFDTVYGHRNDVRGFGTALREFDEALPGILGALGSDDLLFITADHGNDPTYPGTDHTREKVPLLLYRKGRGGGSLGTGETFAEIGATILKFFGCPVHFPGRGFSEVL